jgi:hypothetical protein
MLNKMKHLIFSLLFLVPLISQDTHYLTSKIAIETSIQDKITFAINRIMDRSDFVVMVNVGMQKGYSLSSSEKTQPTPDSGSLQNTSNSSGYTPIPGLLPTVPNTDATVNDNAQPNPNTSTYISGSNGYQLTRVDIAVYLEESKATAGAQQNIERLIRETVPETANCFDCIRFETMRFKKEDGKSENYKELLAKIEELEKERIDAEKQISNWKFDQLEEQLASAEDARKEWEEQARRREYIQYLQDSTRMANLEAFEVTQRAKQDSLLKETTLKLDTSISGRIESESNTKDDLIDLLKLQITNGTLPESDESATNGLLGMKKSTSSSSNILLYVLIAVLGVALLFLFFHKKQPQPIYLKPKKKPAPQPEVAPQPAVQKETPKPQPVESNLNPTSADENDDVMRAEIKSIRQSAVSMSVGQKEGATSIVKDWLDDTPSPEADSSNDTDDKDKQ